MIKLAISSKGSERMGTDEQLNVMVFESVGHFERDLDPRIETFPVRGFEERLGLEGDLVDAFAQDGELAGGLG